MKALIAAFAFNEEEWISTGTLRSIPRIIGGVPTDLLIIDDGSTDRTFEIAKCQGIEVLALPHNCGKSDAMKLAFWYGVTQGYDFLVTLDCDGQHDLADIERAFGLFLEGTDVVLGVRFHPESPQLGTPDDRINLNQTIAKAVQALTGCFYHDVLCGFRGFSARALGRILPRMQSRGHGGELETVFILASYFPELSVRELPIAAIYRGTRDLNELYSQDAATRLVIRATLHLDQLREFAEVHGLDIVRAFGQAIDFSAAIRYTAADVKPEKIKRGGYLG